MLPTSFQTFDLDQLYLPNAGLSRRVCSKSEPHMIIQAVLHTKSGPSHDGTRELMQHVAPIRTHLVIDDVIFLQALCSYTL